MAEYEYKVVEIDVNAQAQDVAKRLEADGWQINPVERAPYTIYHVMRRCPEPSGDGMPFKLTIDESKVFVLKAKDQESFVIDPNAARPEPIQ